MMQNNSMIDLTATYVNSEKQNLAETLQLLRRAVHEPRKRI